MFSDEERVDVLFLNNSTAVVTVVSLKLTANKNPENRLFLFQKKKLGFLPFFSPAFFRRTFLPIIDSLWTKFSLSGWVNAANLDGFPWPGPGSRVIRTMRISLPPKVRGSKEGTTQRNDQEEPQVFCSQLPTTTSMEVYEANGSNRAL